MFQFIPYSAKQLNVLQICGVEQVYGTGLCHRLEQGRVVGPGHSVPSRWQNSMEKEQHSVRFPVDSEVQDIFLNALHEFIQMCSTGAQGSRSQGPVPA